VRFAMAVSHIDVTVASLVTLVHSSIVRAPFSAPLHAI
jgi:hypothetical protein